MAAKKYALLSVADKRFISNFGRDLLKSGYDLLATSGTYAKLRESGVPCKELSRVFKSPVLLGGRVKTLQMQVHAAILADRSNPSHMKDLQKEGITPIDVVVVNFYALPQKPASAKGAAEGAMDMIDIGGPAMVRAAAKNYQHVAVVSSVEQYREISRELKTKGSIGLETRVRLAAEAFAATARYEAALSAWFQGMLPKEALVERVGAVPQELLPDKVTIQLRRLQNLRYGENPHQRAARYGGANLPVVPFKVLQGKEMSYNNFLDASSALAIVSAEYPQPIVACIVKHLNPCGIAVGAKEVDTFIKAREADAQSAFGGVVGLSCPVGGALADELRKSFFEIVVAPLFDADARQVLASKLNLRLVQATPADCRSALAAGAKLSAHLFGVMLQEHDLVQEKWEDLQAVTDHAPAEALRQDILLGLTFIRFLRSNSICLVKDGVMVGAGSGQMSRVDAAEIALRKAGKRAAGAVLVSDGFFPFADAIELAAKAKVGCVVAPAGSKRDQEVVSAANKLHVPFVFSPYRHFLH